jgi:hypothetical protein
MLSLLATTRTVHRSTPLKAQRRRHTSRHGRRGIMVCWGTRRRTELLPRRTGRLSAANCSRSTARTLSLRRALATDPSRIHLFNPDVAMRWRSPT